jgi:undecaprenyl pyrophosphate synthase
MSDEMVNVILYKNGEYEVREADPRHATQRAGVNKKGSFIMYYCPKDEWKYYLLKLLSTESIDKEIEELKKRKKAKEELRAKIREEIGL